jgi:hypothetical protein
MARAIQVRPGRQAIDQVLQIPGGPAPVHQERDGVGATLPIQLPLNHLVRVGSLSLGGHFGQEDPLFH